MNKKMKKKHTNKPTKTTEKLLLCLLLFTALLFDCALAQTLMNPEYGYRRYTTADGLPSNTNTNIIQDGKGFIWIAGPNGLTRYDGCTFTNFMEGCDANLYRLDKDANGNVRAFSQNKLYSFDPKNKLMKTVLAPDRNLTSNSSIWLPDSYGIYFNPNTEHQQSLYKINGNQLEKVLEHPFLSDFDDNTHTFFDVEKQELYLFYEDGPMKIIADNKEIATYPDVFARAACKFNNVLYILSTDGIYCFANRKIKPLIKSDINSTAPVKIIADARGTFYFNHLNTLCRFDGEKIEPIFQANIIKDFIIDNENNLWVVTFQGVYNLFKMNFVNYRLKNETDVVRTVIYHPKKDAIIVGTLEGKIIEIRKNGISEIKYPENQYADFFCDYTAIKEDALYFPGPGDILLLHDREKRWLNLPCFNTPLFVIPLPNGNLLEGGFLWLIEFSAKGKTVKDFGKYAMEQRLIAKPCFDTKGRLWFGGGKGITIYDYSTHNIVKTLFNDSVKLVRYMNNDTEGNVWFASENRLFVSSGDSVRLEKTLPQLITGIYFTRLGNKLIITVLNGFYLFDLTQQNYVFYNHENGFTGGESASGAIAEDADGNIWLPSFEGLFRFNPKDLMEVAAKPKLHLMSVSSSTNNIHWQQIDEMTKLNYKHKNIRFNFIGLSYAAAQNVTYYYRLKGFQEEWSEPTKLREITFNNLPSGDYVFEVYADAGTEESRCETQTFTFSIKPAFWQTWWFITLSILSLMLTSAFVALYLQRQKNIELLQRISIEKQLNDLRIKSIRLKAIPHFNANVLSAIEYYIMNRSKEEANRLLGIYSNFTYQTLREVDKASRSLQEELDYVSLYLQLEKLRFTDKFNYELNIDPSIDKKVQLPNMVLHTYCENAIKHAFASLKSGGILKIIAKQENNIVKIAVEDNGIGRAAAETNTNIRSSKQGLDILNRQIEIYNRFNKQKIVQQVIDIFNEGIACGTRFVLEVPYGFVYQ